MYREELLKVSEELENAYKERVTHNNLIAGIKEQLESEVNAGSDRLVILRRMIKCENEMINDICAKIKGLEKRFEALKLAIQEYCHEGNTKASNIKIDFGDVFKDLYKAE